MGHTKPIASSLYQASGFPVRIMVCVGGAIIPGLYSLAGRPPSLRLVKAGNAAVLVPAAGLYQVALDPILCRSFSLCAA